MPAFLARTVACIALALCLVCCQQQRAPVAKGIEPEPATGFFARRSQEPLRAEPADVAVIFIGGFGENFTARFREVYESMPPLPAQGRQLRACYTWDGGNGNIFFHSTKRIRRDLEAFFAINPRADLVLIGYSYGGSAAMDVVRRLKAPHGRVLVATIDPVSRRERSQPGERPERVSFWVNVYCSEYRNYMDSIALIGGAWRYCPRADRNLYFSGEVRDREGHRYQHAYPLPLFEDRSPATRTSAYEELVNAAHRLKLGAASVQSRHPRPPFLPPFIPMPI